MPVTDMSRKTEKRGYLLYPLLFFMISGAILRLDLPRRYLIWNLILAFAPWIFTELALFVRQRGVRIVFILLGILFFPNAIYLFTDFIHYDSGAFYMVNAKGAQYYMDLRIWASYILTFLSVLLGAALSYECTVNLWELFGLKRPWSRGLFTVLLSIPTGLAVYWGRFLRFNSWNLFYKPQVLLESLLNLGKEELYWILLFGGAYLGATIIFVLISRRR